MSLDSRHLVYIPHVVREEEWPHRCVLHVPREEEQEEREDVIAFSHFHFFRSHFRVLMLALILACYSFFLLFSLFPMLYCCSLTLAILSLHSPFRLPFWSWLAFPFLRPSSLIHTLVFRVFPLYYFLGSYAYITMSSRRSVAACMQAATLLGCNETSHHAKECGNKKKKQEGPGAPHFATFFATLTSLRPS